MRVANILQDRFGPDLAGIHLARVRVIFAAACAVLRGGRLSLTGIGRAIARNTSHKHGIKRVDRLLGNSKAWEERVSFFQAIARRLISPGARPIVLVDWTDFSPVMWTLVAAVSFEGRALVIYSETHPITQYLKPHVHKGFLARLQQVLPDGCLPVIVTDAGFRSPWMREVSRLGWDYVGRLRRPNKLCEVGPGRWRPMPHFFARATRRAKDLGMHLVGTRSRFSTRVVSFKRPQAQRRRPSRRNDRKIVRGAREPWILATSLRCSPNKVVSLYARRMQIEETFRDAKSTRFGFMMSHAQSTSARRADILMLLASLAHLFAVALGLVAEALELDRGYQANTVRTRRVFSLASLGRLLVASDHFRLARAPSMDSAWRTLFERARCGFEFA